MKKMKVAGVLQVLLTTFSIWGCGQAEPEKAQSSQDLNKVDPGCLEKHKGIGPAQYAQEQIMVGFTRGLSFEEAKSELARYGFDSGSFFRNDGLKAHYFATVSVKAGEEITMVCSIEPSGLVSGSQLNYIYTTTVN